MSRSSLVRWLFADRRTGRLVVGQPPNALMLLFLASTAARLAPGAPNVGRRSGDVLRAAQAGSLGLWALDELVRGVNPFRRIGGASVLAVMAALRVP